MPYTGLGQKRTCLSLHYIGIFRPCQEIFWGIRPRNFKKIQALGVDKRKSRGKLGGMAAEDAWGHDWETEIT